MINIVTAMANWVPQVVGRYLNEDWNPTNQGFGAQCWDVPANWSKYLGLPVISTNNTATKRGRWPGWAGNMVDVFPQSAAIAAAFELLPPSAKAIGGDILVWDDSNPAVYPKTHVAVAVRDLGAQLLTISQNSSASLPGNPYPQWTTGPTVLQHLPRRGLLGIIRPRTGINPQGTTTPEEDELSEAAVERIINEVNKANEDKHLETRKQADEHAKDLKFHVQRQVETVGAVTQQLIIDKATPAALAEQIDNAGLARAVADELAKRLVK